MQYAVYIQHTYSRVMIVGIQEILRVQDRVSCTESLVGHASWYFVNRNNACQSMFEWCLKFIHDIGKHV